MIREALCEGSDVEEALAKAKAALGLTDTDDYDFEVVQREEKKKFGLFGGKPAKVRVFIEVVEKAPAKPFVTEKPVKAETAEKPAKQEVTAKAEKPARQEKSAKAEKTEKTENAAPAPVSKAAEEKSAKFIRDILDNMGLQEIAVETKAGDGSLEFELSGEEEGFVIGRRGETLDALQYLTSLVANHRNEEAYIKVTVNVGNYRVKREKTLEILGRKLAYKAIKTGKKTSLEPMNPYERRIIHTAVQKVNGAISWSEGENANRHVVIGPDPKARNNRRGGYNRRGGRGGYNKNRNTNPAPNPDRVPLNEGGATGLYGRIDK